MESKTNNSEEMEKTIENLKTDAVKGEEIKGGGFIMATDAVTDGFWSTTFKTFGWQECQTKCVASRVDKKYATEW